MKVLYASSEALPFAASGGLGDVAGSLPRAIRNRRVTCRVVLPLYSSIKEELRLKMKYITNFTVNLGWRNLYCGVFEANVDGVIYYLLDNEYYFKREGSLYGFYDDGERFAFFSKAVCEMLQYIDFAPDIIHSNDWQTALIPVYLDVFYREIEKYRNIKTVFTIHNIQYQGKYSSAILGDVFGLPSQREYMVHYGDCINLMKGGIEAANAVTTVSPTYAGEILDPWFSHGLDPLLRERQFKLSGILNGIDTKNYDPETDKNIPYTYSVKDMGGKAKDRRNLQKMLGLDLDDSPVLSMITRLVSHKGLDLVRFVLDEIVYTGFQVVVLGSGDRQYEEFFQAMAQKYPKRVSFICGFIPDMARKIYAGSDMFLMPSKSEPCGLSQMVALRYGTIPIVRETGGLKDSIIDYGTGNGNGFTFKTYNAHDMLFSVKRAKDVFENKEEWKALVKAGMESDFSWGKSAATYIDLYKRLLGQ